MEQTDKAYGGWRRKGESSVGLTRTLEKSVVNLGKVQTLSLWEAPNWLKRVCGMVKLAF